MEIYMRLNDKILSVSFLSHIAISRMILNFEAPKL